MRDIVRDLGKPPTLSTVSPEPHARGSGWVEPTPLAGWKPSGDKCIDMLLTDADRKERIARIQQGIAELSVLTNDKK